MLNIFYGRECIDKEKFIYEKINGRALIIVPDQYTLEAEKQAIKYLNSKGLMDIEIISMSRLGHRLINELGGGKRTFIDKYGRHMLLSSIAYNEKEALQVFRGLEEKNTFIELVNNFISEMKQYNGDAEMLKSIIDSIESEGYLKKKLEDIYLLYSQYEKQIEGKYTDSEDYIDLFINNIPKSKTIKESEIWIYGFDSFAPKALDVIEKLIESAVSVNVLLTWARNCKDEDLFQLTGLVKNNLKERAIATKNKITEEEIPSKYEITHKSEDIRHLERELFSVGKKKKELCKDIHITQCANLYNEAESAAAFVTELIRDKGYRYRDIVLVCNDQETRGSIIERVFAEYGIDIFIDKKRSILNSPIVIYIMSMIDVIVNGYYTQDIFRGLKTGFGDVTTEEVEILENYGFQYRVKGTMWKKPFIRGINELGEDGLNKINRIREKVINPFLILEKEMKTAKSVKDFIEKLYYFLLEHCELESKILRYISIQEEKGEVELAEEASQVFNHIIIIFDQIVELIGENSFDKNSLVNLLNVGFSQVEVGIIPPTTDGIIMGTMQRTRTGNVKAMVVIGANEGILPQDPGNEGLFSLEEKVLFREKGKEICKVDEIRLQEERLGIYRNLSKPTEILWISYSVADEDGKEIRPSEIIYEIVSSFHDISIKKDVLNQPDSLKLISGTINSLKHLTEKMRSSGDVAPEWKAVYNWYLENKTKTLQKVTSGLSFTNKQDNLPRELVESLFLRDEATNISLSPSRIEKYSRCPFSHLISYGLRPDERRVYQVAGREIGDIYHICLMKISRALSQHGVAITSENSKWMTITKEECKDFVEKTIAEEIGKYKEGLFEAGNEEKYKAERLEDICTEICWILIMQVRAGKIKESKFEVSFGRGKEIKPIVINLPGEEVYIEGKIDRMDILDSDKIKIIDYKSGIEKFDCNEAVKGYRLQLMLYMKAAQESRRQPAGIFYFHIAEPSIDVSGLENDIIKSDLDNQIRKAFKLNGIILDEPDIIAEIAGEFSGFSDIVQIKESKGQILGTSKESLMSKDEFEELQKQVDIQIKKLVKSLVDGCIDLIPKKSGNESPCDFCNFKGICRFDTLFEGCKYEII
jgi:ATP-dependent helicase/nuclease subunit B